MLLGPYEEWNRKLVVCVSVWTDTWAYCYLVEFRRTLFGLNADVDVIGRIPAR